MAPRKKPATKKATTPLKVEYAEKIEYAENDCWRYHEKEEPKKFKAGQEIPKGWNIDNHKLWTMSPTGEWSRVKG